MRLGLGTMSLTGPGVWGPPADRQGAVKLLHAAAALGVDFFDTADSYGPYEVESLVADALHPYRGITVATKGGLRRQGPGRWSVDCRPRSLREACEGSLRRLRVDCIELYQLHTVDPDVPFEESLGALAELRAEGKIRRIGVCNVSAAELERARRVVEVSSVQNRFSLTERSASHVLTACEAAGIPFVAWAPLAKGYLARSHRRLARPAARHGCTGSQVALAWLLSRSPLVLPIPGTSTLTHLEENVGAAGIRLDPDEVASLARPFYGQRARTVARRTRRLAGRLRARETGARS